jgi:hypothetical protein
MVSDSWRCLICSNPPRRIKGNGEQDEWEFLLVAKSWNSCISRFGNSGMGLTATLNARSKIVFSLEGKENLEPLAHSLFMGVMNPNEIKHELYSTKVMDIVEETRTIRSTSENWSDGVGDFTGQTDTESEGGAIYDTEQQDPSQWNKSGANSSGTSRTSMRGGGNSETVVPVFKSIMGKELSSVQFRPLEEQMHRAMAALFDQKQRHGVARLVGMRAPVNIVTPTVEKKPASKQMTTSFLTRLYEKLPFALPSAEAHKHIADRQQKISAGLPRATAEPIAVKRRIS